MKRIIHLWIRKILYSVRNRRWNFYQNVCCRSARPLEKIWFSLTLFTYNENRWRYVNSFVYRDGIRIEFESTSGGNGFLLEYTRTRTRSSVKTLVYGGFHERNRTVFRRVWIARRVNESSVVRKQRNSTNKIKKKSRKCGETDSIRPDYVGDSPPSDKPTRPFRFQLNRNESSGQTPTTKTFHSSSSPRSSPVRLAGSRENRRFRSGALIILSLRAEWFIWKWYRS